MPSYSFLRPAAYNSRVNTDYLVPSSSCVPTPHNYRVFIARYPHTSPPSSTAMTLLLCRGCVESQSVLFLCRGVCVQVLVVARAAFPFATPAAASESRMYSLESLGSCMWPVLPPHSPSSFPPFQEQCDRSWDSSRHITHDYFTFCLACVCPRSHGSLVRTAGSCFTNTY